MQCPKTGTPCRHCSDEVRREVSRTGDIVSGIRRTEKVQPLGPYCNNDGQHFVKDLPECPVPAALAVPLVPYEIDPVTWMKLKGVP